MYLDKNRQSGFTLLETLVAVVIFSLALVSLMTISAQGIRSVDQATRRATAQFLAQEGLEMIDAARNDNFLDVSAGWLDTITASGACTASSPCRQDAAGVLSGTPFVTCNGSCPPLRQEASTGRFGYSPGDISPYTRTIYIDSSTEALGFVAATSTVQWQRGSVTYSVEAIKYYTNWFQ